jgi:hypothetical protein
LNKSNNRVVAVAGAEKGQEQEKEQKQGEIIDCSQELTFVYVPKRLNYSTCDLKTRSFCACSLYDMDFSDEVKPSRMSIQYYF